MALKKGLAQYLLTLDDLVLESFGGTLSALTQCLLHDKHGRFELHIKGIGGMEKPVGGLVKVSASQLLDNTSDLKVKENMRKASLCRKSWEEVEVKSNHSGSGNIR